MSSNRSAPDPLPSLNSQTQPMGEGEKLSPDYAGLVKFLVEPFLESPESLRVDCERSPSKPKVWIRIAFNDPDKGRVFGRGGRNIQAIRTVLEAAAKAAGESIYMDIYGERSGDRGDRGDRRDRSSGSRSSDSKPSRTNRPRPSAPKPSRSSQSQ